MMAFKFSIFLFQLYIVKILSIAQSEYNATINLNKIDNKTLNKTVEGRSMDSTNDYTKLETRKEPSSVSWDTSDKYGGYGYFYSDFKDSKPGYGFTDNKISPNYGGIDITKQSYQSPYDKESSSKYNLDNLVVTPNSYSNSVNNYGSYPSSSCICKDTYGDGKGYGSGGKYEYGDGYGNGGGYGSGGKYGYSGYEHKHNDYKDNNDHPQENKMPTIVVHEEEKDDISDLYPLLIPIMQNQQISGTTGIISTLGLIFDNIIKILNRRQASGSNRNSDMSSILPVLMALLQRLQN